MDVVAVHDVDEIAHLWHFDSFAERSGGETTKAELLNAIREMDKQCWIVVDGGIKAVALTQVLDNPLQTVELTHCAGEARQGWQGMVVDVIMAWAIERGSKRFRVINRPGWTRFLRDMGLKETHRIMETDIGQDDIADN